MAHNIEEIVQRQAACWEARQRLVREGDEASRRALAHLGEGPWISVSRQIGSGGTKLAAELAQTLQWQAFDREIVTEIARNTDTMEAVMSRLDEHAVGTFGDYIGQIISPGAPAQVAYLDEMIRVVWGIARQGHAIILGRGANWFLKPQFGLRVRVIAPIEQRANALAAEYGWDHAAALRRAHDHDDDQARFIRLIFGREIDDPLGYDLIVNLGGMSLTAGAQSVREALYGKLGAES